MSRRLVPLTHNLIKSGQPLFCPVFKEDGTLLAQKGIILSNDQVVSLRRHVNLYTYAKDLRRDDSEEQRKKRELRRQRYDINYKMRSPFVRLDELKDDLTIIYQHPEKSTTLDELYLVIERLQALCDEAPDASLATLFIDPDNHYTVRHSLHVAILCTMMADYLNWSEVDSRALIGAALTMNLSMGFTQDELQRQEAPLTAEQKNMIKNHPLDGVALLEKLGVKEPKWLEFVLKHHESLDGAGYPNKLNADQIPLGASMLHLADVYCAKVTGRHYREPKLANIAAREVFLDKDTKSQGNLIDVFIRIMGLYPPGSMVKLVNGEVAVVIKRGERVDTPAARGLLEVRGKIIMTSALRNTGQKSFAVHEILYPNRVKEFVNYPSLWGYTSR